MGTQLIYVILIVFIFLVLWWNNQKSEKYTYSHNLNGGCPISGYYSGIPSKQLKTTSDGRCLNYLDIYENQDFYENQPFIYPVNDTYWTARYRIKRGC